MGILMAIGGWRAVATAAFLSVGVPAAAAADSAASPDLVVPGAEGAAAAVDAFHSALGRGDTEAALALLADDVLVFEEGRAERSKSEYARQHLGADAAFSQAVRGEKVRRRGAVAGDLAWIATEGRTRGTYRGTKVNRVTDETMVLRRQGDAWKIAHIHWSSAESSVE